MSKMIVVSIDDNKKADAFLASLQEHKVVAYRDDNGNYHRAPVLFAYLTDATGSVDFGKIERFEEKLARFHEIYGVSGDRMREIAEEK